MTIRESVMYIVSGDNPLSAVRAVSAKPNLVSWLFFGITILSGCHVPTEPKGIPQSTLSKIPLSVGIYYSPELRSYTYEVAKSNLDTCFHEPVLTVGGPSVRMFEQVFADIFRTTKSLDKGEEIVSDRLSIIIEPDIESVEYSCFRGIYRSRILYHFSLFSPTGKPLARQQVTGEGESRANFFWSLQRAVDNVSHLSIEDAAVKIITDFRDMPAIKSLVQEANQD